MLIPPDNSIELDWRKMRLCMWHQLLPNQEQLADEFVYIERVVPVTKVFQDPVSRSFFVIFVFCVDGK